MNDFIEKLHSYQLLTLQSRIYKKLLMFAHSIKINGRAPVELRSQLDLADHDFSINHEDVMFSNKLMKVIKIIYFSSVKVYSLLFFVLKSFFNTFYILKKMFKIIKINYLL